MRKESAIILLFTLFFVVFYSIDKSWASLIGALFCLSIFAAFVSIEYMNSGVQKPEIIQDNSEYYEMKIDAQNQQIVEMQDRIGRIEMATFTTGARPPQDSVRP